MGWAAGVGRIGGIAGPYLVGLMLGGGTFGSVFGFFAAVLLVITLGVLILDKETMGRTLDEISGSPSLSQTR